MRTKAIASARVKTDAVDARTLAHLLRADLLPEAYIARNGCSTSAMARSTCWIPRDGIARRSYSH